MVEISFGCVGTYTFMFAKTIGLRFDGFLRGNPHVQGQSNADTG